MKRTEKTVTYIYNDKQRRSTIKVDENGEYSEIKQQLDEAGVPTREVFFNPAQKQKYLSNQENRKREPERYRELRKKWQ